MIWVLAFAGVFKPVNILWVLALWRLARWGLRRRGA